MSNQFARPKKCRITREVAETEETPFSLNFTMITKRLLPGEEYFHIGFAHDGSHLLNIMERAVSIVIAIPKDAATITE